MRKAVVAATGGRRASRRGTPPTKPPAPEAPQPQRPPSNKQVSPEANNGNSNNKNKQPQQKQPKTKMTADEAALTAKNYRLAKELSELRVRHREECKTVTKLTMENMNLASRCREAISQVAKLKKELTLQKMSVETKQTRSSSPTKGLSPSPRGASKPQPQRHTLDVVKEMDLMDQLVADHQQAKMEPPVSSSSSPKVLPKSPETNPLEEEKEEQQQQQPSPHLVSSDDYEEEDDVIENDESSQPPSLSPRKMIPSAAEGSSLSASPKEEQESDSSDGLALDDYDEAEVGDSMPSPTKALDSQAHTEGSIFPQTASPKVRGGYNEEFPGDLTAPAVRHRMGGLMEQEPEHQKSSLGPFDRLRQRSAMSTISSIDAFEASFNTDFPDSFSPREDSETRKSDTDAYNPFYPSPQRPEPAENIRTERPLSRNEIRDRAAAASLSRAGSGSRLGASPTSDPPGRDRTSMRKSRSPRATSTGSRMSDRISPNRRPATGASPSSSEKLRRDFPPPTSRSPRSTSSPRVVRKPSPVTPSPSSPRDSEAYATPSPSSQASPRKSSTEPSRPEKTGHEVARSRYEKAYASRIRTDSKNGATPQLYSPTVAEDGDIPMRTSLSRMRVYGSARGIDVSEDDELRLNPNHGKTNYMIRTEEVGDWS